MQALASLNSGDGERSAAPEGWLFEAEGADTDLPPDIEALLEQQAQQQVKSGSNSGLQGNPEGEDPPDIWTRVHPRPAGRTAKGGPALHCTLSWPDGEDEGGIAWAICRGVSIFCCALIFPSVTGSATFVMQ